MYAHVQLSGVCNFCWSSNSTKFIRTFIRQGNNMGLLKIHNGGNYAHAQDFNASKSTKLIRTNFCSKWKCQKVLSQGFCAVVLPPLCHVNSCIPLPKSIFQRLQQVQTWLSKTRRYNDHSVLYCLAAIVSRDIVTDPFPKYNFPKFTTS